MLPYCQLEDNIINKHEPIKEIIKNCSKCDIVITPVNYIKNNTICRVCHNENMRIRRKNKNT